eukprot:SAG31_NODE_2234_length_6128_cov_44.016752_3_plen_285_part_00
MTKYCASNGITCVGIGPIVYYSGFTRAFIAGETSSSDEMLENVAATISALAVGKRVIIIDGVGYPSVGSITGTCNGAIARVAKAPVLLVGKKGVGDAVDSYNLNRTYFEARGAKVIGSIFNRLPLEGYYNLENCKNAVESWFAQFRPAHEHCFGMLPELPSLLGASAPPVAPSSIVSSAQSAKAQAILDQQSTTLTAGDDTIVALLAKTFEQYIDVDKILESATQAQNRPSFSWGQADITAKTVGEVPLKRKWFSGHSTGEPATSKRTRAEISLAAKTEGATGG